MLFHSIFAHTQKIRKTFIKENMNHQEICKQNFTVFGYSKKGARITTLNLPYCSSYSSYCTCIFLIVSVFFTHTYTHITFSFRLLLIVLIFTYRTHTFSSFHIFFPFSSFFIVSQ